MPSYEDFTEDEWARLTGCVRYLTIPDTWVEGGAKVAVATEVELERAPSQKEYLLMCGAYCLDSILNPDKYCVEAGLPGRQVLPYVLSLPLEKLPLYMRAVDGSMLRLVLERLKIGK